MIRRDLGYRLINPLHFLCVTAGLGFVGILAEPKATPENPPGLLIFAGLSLFFAVCHRYQRRKEMKKGIVQHTYYIGTSPFNTRLIPAFFRRNRRMARFFDPLCCFAVGFSLLPYCRSLAYWLMFASVCVGFLEQYVHLKELNMSLDTLDGIVHSEVQSRTVEQYEDGPKQTKQQAETGLPTGVGPDINEQIKRRRK
jgi:hypothetical protein